MATKKPDEQPEEQPADQPDVPSEAPVEPSEARKRFEAGEITWEQYVAQENESDAPPS